MSVPRKFLRFALPQKSLNIFLNKQTHKDSWAPLDFERQQIPLALVPPNSVRA